MRLGLLAALKVKLLSTDIGILCMAHKFFQPPILFEPQLAQVGEAAQGERVELPDLVPIERELA